MAKRRGAKVDLDFYGDKMLSLVEQHGDEALYKAGQVIEAQGARNAPKKTGTLASSGYVATATKDTYVRRKAWRKKKKAPKGGAVIAFSAPHAHLIEGGRRKSGVIFPKKKKALVINGQIRSRSSYGKIAAKPFLGPAVEQTKDEVTRETARSFENIFERFMK